MGPTGDGREGGTAAVVGMILVRRRKPTTMRIRHSGIRVGLRKLGAARLSPCCYAGRNCFWGQADTEIPRNLKRCVIPSSLVLYHVAIRVAT